MAVFGRFSSIKQQAPKNHGMAHIAQQRLDHVVARANEQQEEALQVDGTRIQLWSRTEQGNMCTCHGSEPRVTVDEDQRPSDDVLSERRSHSKKGIGTSFKIKGAGENKDKFEETMWEGNPTREPQNLETTDDAELNDLLVLLGTADDNALLSGGDQTPCGICFGTGYTEGYVLTFGQRRVFDASSPCTVTGFELDRDTVPHSFTSHITNKNSVLWKLVELPTYFLNCCAIEIRNNVKGTSDLMAEIFLGEWLELTPQLLESRNGTPTIGDIRVRPRSNKVDGSCRFTHLEIIYQFNEWTCAQIPPESPQSTIDRERSLVNTSLILSSRITNVKSGDIIYADKYDALYRVTDVTDFITQKRQVLGWNSVNVRKVQSYEILSLLRLMYQRNFALSYSGMEQVQGRDLESGSNNFKDKKR